MLDYITSSVRLNNLGMPVPRIGGTRVRLCCTASRVDTVVLNVRGGVGGEMPGSAPAGPRPLSVNGQPTASEDVFPDSKKRVEKDQAMPVVVL